MTVTLTSFDAGGQHTHEKIKGVFLQWSFLPMVADKFNRISPFVGVGRTKACKWLIWFGVLHLMREVPSQITCSLGQQPSMWLLNLYHSTLAGRKESLFDGYFLLTVIDKFNLIRHFLDEGRLLPARRTSGLKFHVSCEKLQTRKSANQDLNLILPLHLHYLTHVVNTHIR